MNRSDNIGRSKDGRILGAAQVCDKAIIANPYDPSIAKSQTLAKHVQSRKRLIACLLIAAPFALAIPVRYWVLNFAGGWFVSKDLATDHRHMFLGLMYSGLMLSISVWCFFAASILLWLDRYHTTISICATAIFGMLAIPAGIFLAIGVDSYFRYS